MRVELVIHKNSRIEKFVRRSVLRNSSSIYRKQASMGTQVEIVSLEAERERIDGNFAPSNPLRGKWIVVPILRL
jgi:hypothetical protein